MKTRSQFLSVLYLTLLAGVARPTIADEPTATVNADRQSASADPDRPAQRKLVFAAPPSALIATAEEIRDEALKALALVGGLDGFHCRITAECLSRSASRPIGLDVAFQDVVLGVPVFGQARVDGLLNFELAPDKDQVSFDVVFAGTVALKGTGRSQDVQIRTDTIVDFSAVKRVHLDQQGMTCEPATCKAKAAITTKNISSSRPRIIGRFSERIAERRTASSKEDAESECAEHLASAICEHLDREVAGVATVINTALKDHLKAAGDVAKARWSEIRFNTADEWIHVARPEIGQPLAEFTAAMAGKAATSPIVFQLPRARLDVNVALTGMRYLQKDSRQPAASSHVAVRQPVKFRPVVELGSETITLRLEFDEPARLAQDDPPLNSSVMP